MASLICEKFRCGPIRTNVYLVLDKELGKSVLIDAAPESLQTYGQFCKNHSHALESVLITHCHWDHFADAARFQEKKVPIYGSEEDGKWMASDEFVQKFSPVEWNVLPCHCDHFLKHDDRLQLLGRDWHVIAVGGHTPGGICYHLPSKNWLFSGDSLFHETVGRSDLPGSNGAQLLREIRVHLLCLPDETEVFPGHGMATTIGHERVHNPFLQ
ncbi:MAG: MBL fold metallo-hydrolase [Puniceicoccales bacterium]|nr:MBL fold metallo-hydrolase [Puniceicoccales bacterium]